MIIWNLVKKFSLPIAVFGGLWVLGFAMDTYIEWSWLTNLFIIIRRFWAAINWYWDTSTMLWLIGLSLTLDIAEWVYLSYLLPIDWFRRND